MTAMTVRTLQMQLGVGSLRGARLAVRVEGVMHEVIRIEGTYSSVTFACLRQLAVLVDPGTEVHKYDDVEVDCMACLASRVSS